MNLFLFLAVLLVLVFFLGKIFEKAKIPWIFSSLLIGATLSLKNPFSVVTSSPEFEFLANMGMFFLLFMIGFEIDLNKMRKLAGFIFRSTFFIIFLEAIVGTFVIHFLFSYSWFISFIVGVSFATVGEIIILPILDEFGIVNTKLGQTIIGIGSFDDIIEITVILVLAFLIGINPGSESSGNLRILIASLIGIFVLFFILFRMKRVNEKLANSKSEIVSLLSFSILFLFLALGDLSSSTSLASLLAGISVKNFVSDGRKKEIGNSIRNLCYGLFAPLFFFSVGLELNLSYLVSSFWIVLIVFFASAISKIVGSYIIGRKRVGKKQSLLLGLGLCSRFSMSIVIIKLLFDAGLVREDLYSVIIASSMLFTIFVPVLFSKLYYKWKK